MAQYSLEVLQVGVELAGEPVFGVDALADPAQAAPTDPVSIGRQKRAATNENTSLWT